MKEKIRKTVLALLSLLLAAWTTCSLVGLVRSLTISHNDGVIAHLVFAAVGGFAFCFVTFVLQKKNKKKWLIFALCSVGYLLVWGLLVGLRLFTAGLCVSAVLLAVGVLFYYGKKIGRKSVILAAVATVLTFCLTAPYFVMIATDAYREKTVPLTAYDDPTALPYAKQATKIYHYYWDTTEAEVCDSDYCMFYQTLQGHLARTSEEQMLITYVTELTPGQKKSIRRQELDMEICAYDGAEKIALVAEQQLDIIGRYYDVEIETVRSFREMMDKVADKVQNYILCDYADAESKAVGLSLCNQMNAVLLPKGLEYIAEEYGWTEVFDATGKDADWLIASPYFEKLNKNLIIMPAYDYYSMETHCDYAVLSGAWVVTQTNSIKALEKYLQYTNRGFTLWGVRGLVVTENAMVDTTARYGGTYLYSQGMRNLATLTGFRLENIKEGTQAPTHTAKISETETRNKHTVCIMFSDGDNMQYTAENNLLNLNQFGSLSRNGETPLSYGMSGMMIELAPVMLIAYYEQLTDNESAVMQISSVGYTYPSKWEDDEAFDEMMKRLVHSMQIADIHTVELMDDISFMNGIDVPVLFDTMQKNFDKYTAQDQIDGCLFIDYQQRYSGFNGEVCWSNGKPIVSARYSLWSKESGGSDKNSLEYISNTINNASTDVTSEDSYSFIIVHAWSGLDEDGEFSSGGDAMAAVQKLIGMFDENVDVVNADEFIARMTKYVKH